MNKATIGVGFAVVLLVGVYAVYSYDESFNRDEVLKSSFVEQSSSPVNDKEPKKIQKVAEDKISSEILQAQEEELAAKQAAQDLKEAQAREIAIRLEAQKSREVELKEVSAPPVKSLKKEIPRSSYAQVYNENGLNIFIDDEILAQISDIKRDYVIHRIALNIKSGTVTVKKDKNNKPYMEITSFKKSLEDEELHYNKINFKNGEHTYYFGYNKSKIEDEKKIGKLLSDIDYAVKEADVKKIVVIGYTDSRGSEDYNLMLSFRRAHSIGMKLQKYDNIETSYVAKGESAPAASNKTAKGRAKNRRVEVLLYGN